MPRRLFALATAVTVGALTASIYVGIDRNVFDLDRVLVVIADTVFAAVGILILRKLPRHPIGWVFLAYGFLLAIETFTRNYVDVPAGSDLPAGGMVLAFIISKSFILYLMLLSATFLLFPTGRLLSERWKAIAWLVVGSGLVTLPPWYLAAGYLDDDPPLSRIANPYAVEGGLADAFTILGTVSIIALMVAVVASAVCLVKRFRSTSGEERLQIRWLAFGGLTVVISLLIALLNWTGIVGGTLGDALSIQNSLTISFIPIAAGIAVLKYRLYDLDVIINRTLVYGALTAALAAVYVGLIFLLSTVITPLTADSDIVVAASTLTVAGLIRPLRGRIQGFIDQRFYRHRYDATRALDSFAVRLRDEIDVTQLSNDMLRLVHETVGPAHASLWLRAPERVPAP